MNIVQRSMTHSVLESLPGTHTAFVWMKNFHYSQWRPSCLCQLGLQSVPGGNPIQFIPVHRQLTALWWHHSIMPQYFILSPSNDAHAYTSQCHGHGTSERPSIPTWYQLSGSGFTLTERQKLWWPPRLLVLYHGLGLEKERGMANRGVKDPREWTSKFTPNTVSKWLDFVPQLFPALQSNRVLILFSHWVTLHFREAWTHYQPQCESHLIFAICGNPVSLPNHWFESGHMIHF